MHQVLDTVTRALKTWFWLMDLPMRMVICTWAYVAKTRLRKWGFHGSKTMNMLLDHTIAPLKQIVLGFLQKKLFLSRFLNGVETQKYPALTIKYLTLAQDCLR